MDSQQHQPRSSTEERRQSQRQSMQSRVRLTLDATHLEGRAENVSHTDVYFFSTGGLPVTVEIEEDGVVKRARGELVRLQRLANGKTSWAIEFER